MFVLQRRNTENLIFKFQRQLYFGVQCHEIFIIVWILELQLLKELSSSLCSLKIKASVAP